MSRATGTSLCIALCFSSTIQAHLVQRPVDILKQIRAVDGALDKVGDLVLRSHLGDHVVTAHERGDASEIIDELMEILKYR